MSDYQTGWMNTTPKDRPYFFIVRNGRIAYQSRSESSTLDDARNAAFEHPEHTLRVVEVGVRPGEDPREAALAAGADSPTYPAIWVHLAAPLPKRSLEPDATAQRSSSSSSTAWLAALAAALLVLLVCLVVYAVKSDGNNHPKTPTQTPSSSSSVSSSSSATTPSASTVTETSTSTTTESSTSSPSSSSTSSPSSSTSEPTSTSSSSN